MLEQGWITSDRFREALANSGSSVTPVQIERWRREGLLPSPRQIGNGRGKGSHTEVPLASVAQAQEIASLYAIRRKRNWVGWQLWVRGFDVAERYWREPLENAQRALSIVRDAGTKFEAIRSETDGADADAIKAAALAIARGTVLLAPFTKLPSDMVETLIGYGIETLRGEFTGFSTAADENPNRDLAAVIEAIGAATAEHHLVGGHGIEFKGQIEPVFREISEGVSRITRQRRIAEPPLETRQEFLMALEIGIWLNRHFKPQFGRNALGLGAFSRIAANSAITLQATMLLVWAEFRQISETKLVFSEIANLHNSALELAPGKGS